MSLASVDLNLFLVLHAVLEEGSVTRAAARLHLTQSAVSNALARLRAATGDPLFVRSGRGLAPTPRAEALRGPVAEAIAGLEVALATRFDPATTERTFTLACADHHLADAVPRLAQAFARELPCACLRAVSVDYLLATDGLAGGDVDAVLAPAWTDGAGLRSTPLFAEAALLVVREGHPTVSEPATVDALNAAAHVDVHVTLGRPGEVHRETQGVLARAALHRRVALVVPSFTAAVLAAARTDLVAWVPEHAVRAFGGALPVRTMPTPFPELRVPSALVWHERTDADPGCAAFRALVCRELAEPG